MPRPKSNEDRYALDLHTLPSSELDLSFETAGRGASSKAACLASKRQVRLGASTVLVCLYAYHTACL
jgi:hypothetical protein